MPSAVLASAWVSSRHASVGAVPGAPADGAPGAFDAEAVAGSPLDPPAADDAIEPPDDDEPQAPTRSRAPIGRREAARSPLRKPLWPPGPQGPWLGLLWWQKRPDRVGRTSPRGHGFVGRAGSPPDGWVWRLDTQRAAGLRAHGAGLRISRGAGFGEVTRVSGGQMAASPLWGVSAMSDPRGVSDSPGTGVRCASTCLGRARSENVIVARDTSRCVYPAEPGDNGRARFNGAWGLSNRSSSKPKRVT